MNQDIRQQRLKSLLATQPRLHRLDQTSVNILYADANARQVPVTVITEDKDALLHKWIPAGMAMVREQLRTHGALLFRGFNVASVEAFRLVVQAFSEEAMPYTQRSSPRTEIKDRIYTSTDHPADQYINMHNELSYSYRWPLQIMFCCMQPAAKGGETPIADSRQVLKALSPQTRQQFRDKGIMYVRNLGGGLGLDWQQVFQTDSRESVEEECRQNEMHFEWKDNNRLQIRWTRPAIVKHPATGEEIWFNHAYFFNAANLDEAVADAVMSREDMPFNTFYGDGSPIPVAVLEEIGAAYERSRIVFPWKKGDVLLMDNMLMSHGRYPYEGNRKIMVAMWEPNR
ncbi:TauD/TfdA family dioxygenase [Chitinophaga japonensis]|uniref:Alpha-ketoglutarate-dependent taurine dioxygenase n=1 Tax=Chitinophaga japonensis TaxID=104662 RepID=A0A562SLF8_CHIJA|nr:TauD/TfdA family dioxygenase [Chitinophaga japonensis]TWI82131.1 alpha-ketoglutarate-dependent taurine dioxygenase [Chitinophaga japonensis]